MNTTKKLHTTPRGRKMTDRQYAALRSAQSFNPNGRGSDAACEHGHFGCAVWEDGPCFDEVLSRIEAEGR